MNKEMITTISGVIAVIVAIFMLGWAIRGEISANTAAISKLEGALLAHINGHNHMTVVAENTSEAETQ